MRQVEVAKTICFAAPRHTRSFFQALVADNLDIGRPDGMEVVFDRQIRSTTGGYFKTAVDRDNEGCGRQRLLPALADEVLPRRWPCAPHRGRHQ